MATKANGGAARVPVAKTYKIYIDGKFPRTESGRYLALEDKKGRVIANVCRGSRKDFRNATVAARKAFKAASNAKHVLTLETLADLQALSFRNADKMGTAIRRVYDVLSEHFEVYDNERVFRDDLVKFRKLLFSSQIFDDLSVYWQE